MRDEIQRRVRRGDIFYISVPYHTGHETKKDRPGVIVSCNEINKSYGTVVAAFCSSSCSWDAPEHVRVHTTPRPSVVMCEQIYTVDRTRLGEFLGRVTRQEQREIDVAILAGLGIADYDLASLQNAVRQEVRDEWKEQDKEAALALARAEAERNIYRQMYESLLGIIDKRTRGKLREFDEEYGRPSGLLEDEL